MTYRSSHRGSFPDFCNGVAKKLAAVQHILCAASRASSCYASPVGYGESVVSQRVLPYITAIGIGIAAASALSFLSLAVASGIRFALMH